MAKAPKNGPTPEEIERGKAFAMWLRAARSRRGFTKRKLEQESGVSDTYIGVLENDGINNSTGEYQRPGTDVIEKLAVALSTDENLGRIAAGWTGKRGASTDAPRIATDSSLLIAQLADIVRKYGGGQLFSEPQNDAFDLKVNLNDEDQSSLLIQAKQWPDPLAAYGDDVDPRPYLYALRRATDHSATIERVVDAEYPSETSMESARWPARAIAVRGECMEPYLSDGDIALVLPAETVYDGCFVTATVDLYNAVCKRIRIPGDGSPAYLEPINGEGRISEDRFTITGVVADKISRLLPPRPPAGK